MSNTIEAINAPPGWTLAQGYEGCFVQDIYAGQSVIAQFDDGQWYIEAVDCEE